MYKSEKIAEMKRAGASPKELDAFGRAYSEGLAGGKEHDEAMAYAELTVKGRKHIKDSNFALPGKRYPIHDAAHARDALARVAQNGTPAEQAAVRKAVAKKYPGISAD